MSWKLYPASELRNLSPEWSRLNRGPFGSPLLELAFAQPLLDVFGTGNELLAVYEPGGTVRAMMILAPRGGGVYETFNPSQAPIGLSLHDGSIPDWNAALGALVGKLPGFALAVGVTQQDPDIMPRPPDSGSLMTLDHIQTARTIISGSFDDYWNARGKNLRTNLRKQRNRLEKSGIPTRLEMVEKEEDVAEAVADYGRLESAGWKGKEGTAVHAGNIQGRFYCAMLEAFARQDACRIFRYRYGDRLVASYLAIEGNGSIVILKTAYDEQIGNDTSPAILMRQDVFRQLFSERRLDRIESYGKVVDWNSRWSDEIRTLYHITRYRWPTLLMLRKMRRRAAAAT